jgi:hypothetical protein
MTASMAKDLGGNARAIPVTLSLSDLPEVAHFVAVQSGKEPVSVGNLLRWFLLDNPARNAEIPLGWGLRSNEGHLVGCILFAPQMFRYRQQNILVLGSSSFFVDKDYRGFGGLLFLKFSQMSKQYPLFANSANADAAALWKARGAVPIANSDHELLGIVNWSGVVEEGVHQKFGSSSLLGSTKLAGALGSTAALLLDPVRKLKLPDAANARLTVLPSAEEVMKLQFPNSSGELTAVRDSAYIHWRYFSGSDSTAEVFAFHCPQIHAPVVITVNRRLRGHRSQIRTLHLLDVYPQISSELFPSLASALVERYQGSIDMIAIRGFDSACQIALQSVGFIRRKFDAPNGWLLDKSGLLPTQNWRFVPADGDWLI